MMVKIALTRLLKLLSIVLSGALFFTSAPYSHAAWVFDDPGFFTETVATLPAFSPIGIAWAPDGRMFVWTKNGTVRIVKNGVLLPTPFIDISNKVNTYEDRGLLGLAIDPNYAANGYVYLLYVHEGGGDTNSTAPKVSLLTRVTSDPSNRDIALAGSETTILGSTAQIPCPPPGPTNNCIPADIGSHAIGTVRFGADGKLWIGSGDGASYNFADPLALRSQNLDSLAGKILRINPDGTAPSDNPFYNGPTAVRSKVWAYGFRNPYRFNLHPITGVPYAGEVGWVTWEEVNRVDRAANFGWPCYEGAGPQPDYQAAFTQCVNLLPNQVAPPLYTYFHDAAGGSAAVGGAFFQGNQYPAQYVLNFFFADYSNRWVRRITFDAAGNVTGVLPFASNIGTSLGGLVSLEMGPDGFLYYVEITTGVIGRVRHTSGGGANQAPIAVATANPTSGYSPLTVNFSSGGSFDPEGFALTYLWDLGDGTTSTLPNPTHTYSAVAVASYKITLTVTDNQGLTAIGTTTVTLGSTPPAVTITSPINGTNVTPGMVIAFSGSASDAEDGTLPPSALSWTVLIHHNTHVHILGQFTGASGSVVVEDHDPVGVYSYEFILKATDSSGLSSIRSVTLPLANPLGGARLAFGMNEGAGTTIADASGNGNSGTLVNGPTWGAGQYGGGIVFDGVNDALNVSNPAGFNFGTADFTIMAWVKRNQLGGGQRHIFSKCDPVNWASGCKELYFGSNNVLNFGSFATGDTASIAIADINWHHVAVTFVDSTNTLQIYVDGTLRTTATKALEADGANHVVTIGNQGGSNPFSGSIDEVRIYSRALSAGELLTDMNTPIAPAVDTTAPVLSNGQPSGTLAVGTTQVTLSVTTNESATCRYSTTASQAYGAMANTFGTTGATTHSTLITGLVNGQTYSYYVRCQDGVGNANNTDFLISFAVAAPDTIPPTVSMTAPANGATVSGSITVSATASDNIGVVGVQFLLDGANLGAEDTAAPYSVAWNTAGASNGTHTLSARARDAAGNLTTALSVTVTVSNAAPDTTPPTASMTAPASGATVSGSISVSAAANDNVGVAGVQFLLDGVALGAEVTTAPYTITWNSAGTTNGSHTLSARARDAAGNQTTSTGVGVTVSNAAPSGLQAAFGFNEGSGATSADQSGNGRTATLVNGPLWAVGQYGNGISFDGVNDSVSVSNGSTLNFGSSNFTVMMWFKRSALGGAAQRHLFSKCAATTWQSGCKELYFAGNTLRFGSFATGDTNSITINDTAWHHLAVVFARGTNTLQIYVDGTLRTTATKNLEADNATHVVTIGNQGGNNPFSGLIDEVRIYSRTLSATEISIDRTTPIQ